MSGPSASALASAPVLAALLSPQARAAFAGGVWPRQPAWTHGDPARLPAGLRRIAQDGIATLFDRYRGPQSFGRGARDVRSFDVDAPPQALWRMGLTVHLHDAASAIDGADAMLRTLEHELQCGPRSARLAAFASPKGDGLPLHYDGEDVISVQLVGRKRFEVAPVDGLRFPVGAQYGPGMVADEAAYPAHRDGFPDGANVHGEGVEMRPGSVLVLPRGTWHRTEALDDSLSVSIVLRPALAVDAVLAQLRSLLLQDERWREPLYGGALARLPALMRTLPDAAAQVEATLPAATGITPATRLQRIPSSTLSFTKSATGLHLNVMALDDDWVERTTLDRPAGLAFAPVLDWLATSRAAFDADALARRFPSLAFDDLRQLLHGLVQVSLLRVLPYPALRAPAEPLAGSS